MKVMNIFIIIFSGLFWQEISGQTLCRNQCDWGPGEDPEPGWIQEYQRKFDKMGVFNFSSSVAHLLHGLTVEAALTSFNIKLPKENGIPAVNPDFSADVSDALIENIPSRPTGFSSQGLHGFVDIMDHINNPAWMINGSKLGRVLHAFHMQELWALARNTADNFREVADEICTGALDHANNGVDKTSINIFKLIKNNTFASKPLTWDDNGESWNVSRATLPHVSKGYTKSTGLYLHCLMKKFRPTEQPIEVNGCCNSKTVGEYSYTKVSTGKVPTTCLNNCIYTRDDKPGYTYCFGSGDQEVHCGNSLN